MNPFLARWLMVFSGACFLFVCALLLIAVEKRDERRRQKRQHSSR